MTELIYLACPFRHEDPAIQRWRASIAHRTAAYLSSKGRFVFSPLTHNEPLLTMAPHVPKTHWMEFDLAVLSFCKKLVVIKVDGWETSWGVQKEIAFAKERGIPIEEIEPIEETKLPSCSISN
jgi:hypothetical protein